MASHDQLRSRGRFGYLQSSATRLPRFTTRDNCAGLSLHSHDPNFDHPLTVVLSDKGSVHVFRPDILEFMERRSYADRLLRRPQGSVFEDLTILSAVGLTLYQHPLSQLARPFGLFAGKHFSRSILCRSQRRLPTRPHNFK